MARLFWKVWGPLALRGGRFPAFIGIGAQKAGTTWLHANLKRHPDVFLPRRKELHFFDSCHHRGLRYYRSHFSEHGGRKCGEITPSYSLLPREVIREIHAANPELRIFLVLRDPVERAWSAATMDLAERCGRPMAGVPRAELESYLRAPGSLARGSYSAILDRWTEFFPREQIFVGFFESIKQQPLQLFKDVLDHIGVNSSIQAADYALDQVVVPAVAPDCNNKGIARTLSGKRKANHIPTDLRQLLVDLYGKEIEELGRRFGAPCQNWLPGRES